MYHLKLVCSKVCNKVFKPNELLKNQRHCCTLLPFTLKTGKNHENGVRKKKQSETEETTLIASFHFLKKKFFYLVCEEEDAAAERNVEVIVNSTTKFCFQLEE